MSCMPIVCSCTTVNKQYTHKHLSICEIFIEFFIRIQILVLTNIKKYTISQNAKNKKEAVYDTAGLFIQTVHNKSNVPLPPPPGGS